MNVRDSIRKVSALAGSTLMIGLSLGSAASLADFPGKYVDSQGTPTAEVVVGSQGSVADVVGAVQIGAALGQSSLRVGQVRDQRTVEVAGGSSWTTDGALLNSRNDDLYGGEDIDTVRQTLTADDLDALSSTTFQDAAGNSQDIEQYLYVGSQPSGFGNPGDTSDEDPFQYVYNPSSVSDTSYLYRLQANFGDGLELSDTSQSDNKNDDVLGEDLTLFGKSFTISEDSFTSDNAGQLVLYGSSQEYDLETGESTEIEIDGETHTLEVRAVTDSSTAAFYVDGELREQSEDGSVTIDGTEIRVSDVIQTSTDTSEGLVTFAIGSEEYVLEDGEAIEDSDGDEIEGTHVTLEGSSVGSSNTLADDVELSTIEVSVGAADSDDTYVRAGESFQDPVFDDIVFRHGGLLPDAGEQDDPDVSFSTDGDDFASVDAETEDGSLTTNFAEFESISGEEGSEYVATGLAHDTNEDIVVVEGADVSENDYVLADAGGFSHMWEVTGIDEDETNGASLSSDDEATIDLRDVVSGSDVTVDLDADTDGEEVYEGTEVIDGQTYAFELQAGSDPTFTMAWGAGSHGVDPTTDDAFSTGDETTVFPALDLESGGGLAFTEEVTGVDGLPQNPSLSDFNTTQTGATDLISSTVSGDHFSAFVNVSEVRDGKSVGLVVKGTDESGSPFARRINKTSDGSLKDYGSSQYVNETLSGLSATWSADNMTLSYENQTDGSQFSITSMRFDAAGGSGDVQVSVEDGTLDNAQSSYSGSVQGVTIPEATRKMTVSLLLPSTETSSTKKISSGSEITYDSVDSISNNPGIDGTGYDVTFSSDQTLSLSVNSNDIDQASALVIEPEDDQDTESVYVETPTGEITGEGGLEDGELDVADVTYAGATRSTAELESDDDVTVGYDYYGGYTWWDSAERGEMEIYLPESQSTVGAAFTGAGDSLARSATGTQQATVEYRGVKNNRIRGRLPAFASMDSDITDQQKDNRHMILVGGPAVNQLVADLAQQNDDVWTQDQWQDRDGEALIQLVEDAFSEGSNALIVAGHSAEDTVRAARYISNWDEHRSSLRGTNLYQPE